MHAKCLVLCINHGMQVYPFKCDAYICKMTPLYAMHVYPPLRCKSYMQVQHVKQVMCMLICKFNMLCKLCVWCYVSYVHVVMQVHMQVMCMMLCKLCAWCYASYVYVDMQVMFIILCKLCVWCYAS